ncbi:ABC transporter ATP-binding protein [Brackiella oedipodis]|uniref:ABC transporter ATP-binding protein n=1 Tax=Brackiella oedipodis TaxID=124225 RepID=UPI0005711B21|nr:ABC transporter ATP-binding protein [Brackiella oedipodis]
MTNASTASAADDIIVSIKDLKKSYKNGFTALHGVNLDIKRGEILALLGPNGAGKTTMIGIITGLVNASSGQVLINGLDIQKDYRQVRPLVGLVPQELLTESFEKVYDTVAYSRGLFGKKADPAKIEQILKDLHLWDKRDNRILSLSGGMKRRVLIAKALVHDPEVLFLDEPTAGVDVELRRDLWRMVSRLTEQGMTIILTTHYIEEAEDMADRIAVINHGRILLVQDKDKLMGQLGKKELSLHLVQALTSLPECLHDWPIRLENHGHTLVYTYSREHQRQNSFNVLLSKLLEENIQISDIHSSESSLEDIFVSLVKENA